jgi:hypothetical protein
MIERFGVLLRLAPKGRALRVGSRLARPSQPTCRCRVQAPSKHELVVNLKTEALQQDTI